MALPISDDALAAQPSIPLEPLGGVLETIDQGIVLLASDSFPCYTNAAAERLLVADSERGVLTREMRTVSRAAMKQNGAKPAEVEVSTKAGKYRMRATLLLQKIDEIRNRTRCGADDRDATRQRFGDDHPVRLVQRSVHEDIGGVVER